jgi:hypothetical protein
MRSTAQQGFDWVASVAVEADGGLAWRENDEQFDDVYAGTAGVLLGCAEAAAYGLDVAETAAGAVGRLLHLVEQGPDAMPEEGLFTGWAGVSTALRAWSEATGDGPSGAGAEEVRRQVAGRVMVSEDRYTDIISGDAGILLELLIDQPEAATVLADRLVQRAEPAPGGLHWRMTEDWPYLMPGFSHGTAGVAFALARAGGRLQRPDLIAVAVQGAETLIAAANTPDGWALPLAIPPRPNGPAVNVGWCHGPTGTVRLFAALPEDERWTDATEACLQALRDSRVPDRLYPGFWDNLGRCCGTAGVGQVLLDQGVQGPLLDRLVEDVLARTTTTRYGVAWSNTEHTLPQPELPPQPGFMQGAAGIAGWLARLDAVCAGETSAERALPWL